MSDRPPRKDSDLTIPIPREALPPVSRVPLSIEQLADLARAERDAEEDRRDAETLVECPCCDGLGMVKPSRRPQLEAMLAAHRVHDITCDLDEDCSCPEPDR